MLKKKGKVYGNYSVLWKKRTASKYSFFTLKQVRLLKANEFYLEGALSGLIQFLATESPLKLMKNVFYFTLRIIFILKIFKVLY